MNNLPVFVGLDYHEQSIQVSVLEPDGRVRTRRRCANDLAAVLATVPPGRPVRAALEASTGTADLAEALRAAGWAADLAHPGYVARLRQSPDKTDLQDGDLLADLQRVGYLPRVWLAPLAIRELRKLVHYRGYLVAQRRATKLQLRALLRDHRQTPPASAWTKLWWAWLKTLDLPPASRWIADQLTARLAALAGQIAAAERQLHQATAADPVVAQLRQQPGIGPVTAWVLRAGVGDFTRFRSGKQLARFCGLSPRNASSGARQADGGLIQAADPYLRATLLELAPRLQRAAGPWRALGQRLRARGKAPNLAAAAVANRYVRWLYHRLQPGQAG